MEQSLYDRLYNFCRGGALPSHLTQKKEKDSLRRKGKNFLVKDGLLFYREKRRNVDLQVKKISELAKTHCYVA